MAADENRIIEFMAMATELEGVALCPETAACLLCLQLALAEGHVDSNDRIVVFNTGAMQKYVEVIRTELPRVDRHAVDWEALARPV